MSARKSQPAQRLARGSSASLRAAAEDFMRRLEMSEAASARDEVQDLIDARALLQALGLMKGGGS